MRSICTVFQTSTAFDSKAEAAGLVHDLLVVAGAECALVGEEQPFGEDVAELAAVQLELDLAARAAPHGCSAGCEWSWPGAQGR